MQEKNSIIVELDNRRFLKELDPGLGTKTSTDKHIPVAAHEVAGPTRGSKISQGIDHRLMMGVSDTTKVGIPKMARTLAIEVSVPVMAGRDGRSWQ